VENDQLRREVEARERSNAGVSPAKDDAIRLRALLAEKEGLLKEIDDLREQVLEGGAVEARNAVLSQKVVKLEAWSDDAAAKLKKDEALRAEVERENEDLRQRVLMLTEATERLRSRNALLEDQVAAEKGLVPSNLQKRVAQLEDTLSSARDSLKRKRDREKLLAADKEKLERAVSTLRDEVKGLSVDNVELREKLSLALSGLTSADGLLATVAKSFEASTHAFRRGDVVTVLAAEGEWARVTYEGEVARLPINILACVGIPILQYLDLVIPDRAAMDKMLDDWLVRLQVKASEPEVRIAASPVAASPVSADHDALVQAQGVESVRSIRRQVADLLSDIEDSMSASSSAANTPRASGYVVFDEQARREQALLSSVDELKSSAREYNRLLVSLQQEAAPLLQGKRSCWFI
jgi:hypothetical protein